MKPKIVDILTKILEGLGQGYSFEELNQYLIKKKKYDQQTLSIAFSLLYDKISFDELRANENDNKQKKSMRFLTEEEKEILGEDNYNYLLHLYNVGLINSEILEEILEQISIYPENRITRNEINWLVLLSLVEYDVEVPPGSRILLYTSDSVN